ncbi:LysR family transcriptional regulator, partial [Rhizobium leguminosarum]
EMITCTSPSYIQNFGMPERPADLEAEHYTVTYFRAHNNRTLPFEVRLHNEVIETSPLYIASVNDSRTDLTAALTGLGSAQV